MPMTNKMQSQRIDTALPSDLISERNTDSTISGVHPQLFVHTDAPVCCDSRVCVQCRAKNGVRQVEPLRAPEFILNCLCCVLLIAFLLGVGYILNSWAERGFDNLFDHWVWHEPLNDWNL